MMDRVKVFCQRLFVDGLLGALIGFCATAVLGALLSKLGIIMGGAAGGYILVIGRMLQAMIGAGIGSCMAYRLDDTMAAPAAGACAGMLGAYGSAITAKTVLSNGVIHLAVLNQSLLAQFVGAFIAVFIGIEVANLFSNGSRSSEAVIPAVVILVGGFVGIFMGPAMAALLGGFGGRLFQMFQAF